MQRHGQQSHGCKHPFSKGDYFYRIAGQSRKQQQVGQPPQSQGRGKAQMEQVRHKHGCAAGQIEQRILVGLQFCVLLMAVVGGIGGGKQGIGKFFPGKYGRVFILQGGIYIGFPAETGGSGHMSHLPLVV